MASSKARSRNQAARARAARAAQAAQARGSGPAARTAASKAQAQKEQPATTPQAATPSAATPQAATPSAATAQAAEAQTAKAQATKSQARQPGETAPAGRAKRNGAAVTPEASPAGPATAPGPPRWLQLVSLALAVLGLAVSAYETWAHFHGSHLAGCPTGGSGTFNCSAVITSPQSMVFGVFPVAILGLVFYVAVTALMTPWAWRAQRREVGLLRLAAMIVGMGFAMYLIYAEVVQIDDICEYCTGVHVITFLLFCITVVAAAIWGLGKPAKTR
jgi:uncharacterized membrane protein